MLITYYLQLQEHYKKKIRIREEENNRLKDRFNNIEKMLGIDD